MNARITSIAGHTAKAGWRTIPVLALLGLWGCPQERTNKPQAAAPPLRRLTIITPHNAKIRSAFSHGFSEWRDAQGRPPVTIEWIVRGTPQCVEYVDRLFTGAAEGRELVAPDVMFGGGIADHALLASKGYAMKVELADAPGSIPRELHGMPLRAPDNEWFATGLSSFGLVFNERDCGLRGIAPPQTWADLADPRFAGWIGLAAPEASGSHRQAMVLIIEHQGWEKGWATLLRILANARAVLDSSSTVLDQVEHGVFLAAFAVNFDGLARADDSGGRVVYVNPAGATAVMPDVLSVLKTAKDVPLSQDFVRYCLSEPGQTLWGMRAEVTGRAAPTLYHYPIDPHLYEEHADQLAVTENPYKTDFGLKVDADRAQKLAGALVPLMRAAAGGNHVLLQRAWEAIIQSGMDAEAVAELTRAPLTEEEAFALAERYAAADAESADALVAEWSAKFRAQYEGVVRTAGQ